MARPDRRRAVSKRAVLKQVVLVLAIAAMDPVLSGCIVTDALGALTGGCGNRAGGNPGGGGGGGAGLPPVPGGGASPEQIALGGSPAPGDGGAPGAGPGVTPPVNLTDDGAGGPVTAVTGRAGTGGTAGPGTPGGSAAPPLSGGFIPGSDEAAAKAAEIKKLLESGQVKAPITPTTPGLIADASGGKGLGNTPPAAPPLQGGTAANKQLLDAWHVDTTRGLAREYFPPSGPTPRSKTVISYTIARDGTLVDARISAFSGSSAHDQAVLKAVRTYFVSGRGKLPDAVTDATHASSITVNFGGTGGPQFEKGDTANR